MFTVMASISPDTKYSGKMVDTRSLVKGLLKINYVHLYKNDSMRRK